MKFFKIITYAFLKMKQQKGTSQTNGEIQSKREIRNGYGGGGWWWFRSLLISDYEFFSMSLT